MSKGGITLYVPAFNASRYLPACLEGAMRQTRPPDELLVIDDGSADDTAEIAERLGARVIRHGTNRGIGAARNTALREASHEIVAHLDSDAVAAPDWLEKLEKALDDDIAGAGGKLIEKYQDDLVNRWRAVHMPQHWGDSIVENPTFLAGAGAIYRKSAVLAVGGYDERCRRNFEDNDLGLRLAAAGYRLKYIPDAVAYHLRRDTLGSLLMTNWGWTRRPRDATSLNFKIRKVLINIWTLGRKVPRDWRERSPGLFALTLLVTANNIVMDIRYFLTGGEDPVEAAPKISVIIPAYNAAQWIKDAVESALAQTLRPHEIIVIDDGSTDDTQSVLAAFKSNIIILKQNNSGVSAARNEGLKRVTGDWVAFLDADDKWLPGKLERVMNAARLMPDAAMFSHDVFVMDELDNVIGLYKFKRESIGNAARSLLLGNSVITSSVVIRSDAARAVGEFRMDLKKPAGSEDWDYWLRVAMKFRIEHISEPLALYRRLSASATRSSLDDALHDSLMVVEDAGRLMDASEADARVARANAYRGSAVRRMAALDGPGARRDLNEALRLSNLSAGDAAMFAASFLPRDLQRLLLKIKRARDAHVARREFERFT